MINKIKAGIDWILDVPVLGAFIIMAVSYLLYSLVLSNLGIWIAQRIGAKEDLIYVPLDIIGLLLFLWFHKWWNRDRYKGSFRKFSVDKKFVIIVIIYWLVDNFLALMGIATGRGHVPNFSYTMLALFAGIIEEIGFRVMPMSITMRRKGDNIAILLALVTSGIGFGLVHSVGALMSGDGDLVATIFKVFLTGASGTVFGAIYLRTGNILPSMIFHAIHDYLSFALISEDTNVFVVSEGVDAQAAGYYILMTLFYVTITTLLIKGHTNEIKEIWNERWGRENGE